jgi:hypothetical protein
MATRFGYRLAKEYGFDLLELNGTGPRREPID